MKALRTFICVAFAAMTVFFVYVKITTRKDTMPPVITCSQETLNISVKNTENDLLKYVTAYDEKDGDLTSQIIIENSSPYVTDGKCDMTFVVADYDNNVGRLTVPVVYTDYYAPRFIIKKPLVVPIRTTDFDFSDYIEVDDCFDGNSLSNSIVTYSDLNVITAGSYSATLKVTNSRFDSSEISVNITVLTSSEVNTIPLTAYSVYCKLGDKVDFSSYIPDGIEDVTVDSSKVDMSHTGVYEAYYSAEGYATTPFVIICEEG